MKGRKEGQGRCEKVVVEGKMLRGEGMEMGGEGSVRGGGRRGARGETRGSVEGGREGGSAGRRGVEGRASLVRCLCSLCVEERVVDAGFVPCLYAGAPGKEAGGAGLERNAGKRNEKMEVNVGHLEQGEKECWRGLGKEGKQRRGCTGEGYEAGDAREEGEGDGSEQRVDG